MRVIVSGGRSGQLRQELQRTQPAAVDAVFLARDEMDMTCPDAIGAAVREHQPDWIINAAAYTAVDKAETDQQAAYAVNAEGVAALAKAAKAQSARLAHVSTDFVFNGTHASPYQVDQATAPLGVYGESKLAGEKAMQDVLGGDGLIVRTSWVYSALGNNFVKTMLRLMDERDEIGVIADQVGTPTWARDLANALWESIDKGLAGLHHWTDAGVASWYDFAVAIYEEARSLELLSKEIQVRPLTTDQYPTPAQRPAYSVLDKTQTWEALGRSSDHWRVSLRKMMQELS